MSNAALALKMAQINMESEGIDLEEYIRRVRAAGIAKGYSLEQAEIVENKIRAVFAPADEGEMN